MAEWLMAMSVCVSMDGWMLRALLTSPTEASISACMAMSQPCDPDFHDGSAESLVKRAHQPIGCKAPRGEEEDACSSEQSCQCAGAHTQKRLISMLISISFLKPL